MPSVLDIIKQSKISTLEDVAKLIAKTAEHERMESEILGIEATLNCSDIVNYNSNNYKSCNIEFDNDVASVSLVGQGKFEGLSCSGTKDSMSCSESDEIQEQIDVDIPYRITYDAPKSRTNDYFYYTITPKDGAVPPLGATNGIYTFSLLGVPTGAKQGEVSLSFIYSEPGEYVYELKSYEPNPRENITRNTKKQRINIIIVSDNNKLKLNQVIIKPDKLEQLYASLELEETYVDAGPAIPD